MTVVVFIYLIGAFDYYNREDLAGVSKDGEVVSELQAKFIDARDQLMQSGGIIEGSKILASHLRTERNNREYHMLKRQRLSVDGTLGCETWHTDFFALLGQSATRVIEYHHQLPLAHASHEGGTARGDLVLLCGNCHRIAHTDEDLLRNFQTV